MHYFCYIRHITKYSEIWLEYNDEDVYKLSNWNSVVTDCVKDCHTPTLLIFENIKTVENPSNLQPLKLSEDEIENLKEMAMKTTRAARLGRVDLNKKKDKSLIVEGLNPFPTDSSPPVATTDEYSKPRYSSSGLNYGVTSSHKVIEDNWHCEY